MWCVRESECDRRGIYPSIGPKLAEAEIGPPNFEAWKESDQNLARRLKFSVKLFQDMPWMNSLTDDRIPEDLQDQRRSNCLLHAC